MKPKKQVNNKLARHDLPQFFLLVALYFVQGIPVGLAFGTVPFLLKSMAKDTSFASLGLFSMATYPYSLKILWSPIIDSCYNRRIGRRRSWIIPIQLISGIILILLGWAISKNHIFKGIDNVFHGLPTDISNTNIISLVWCFGLLVFLCATQDICVDGWALTILSKQSLSYASTAQTVGLNIGYFLSFTVFISLNSSDFINKYFRTVPKPYGLISLGGYMKFAGFIYIILTLYVGFCTSEHPLRKHSSFKGVSGYSVLPRHRNGNVKSQEGYDGSTNELVVVYQDEEDDERTQNISYIYKCFLKVLGLKPIQLLALVHLVSKIAFQCNEGATNLKLLERGFKRENLAVTVLIDVPFEIIFGYYVAKWSSDNKHGDNPNNNEGRNVYTNAQISNYKNKDGNSNSNGNGNEDNDDDDNPYEKMLRNRNNSFLKRINSFLVGDAGVLTPWLYGFLGRLVAAALGSYVVYKFPRDKEISTWYFILVIVQHLLGSFMNTVQFVGISSFHTRIADPVLGGTYMTLLNTLSNFGGTWPRIIVMWMISYFTVSRCEMPSMGQDYLFYGSDKNQKCGIELDPLSKVTVVRDGYYVVNTLCILLGLLLYFGFLKRQAQSLQRLPISSWRCAHNRQG